MKTNFKKFLILSLAPLLVNKGYAKIDKPNIIIIFTDDQGFNDVSCYGSPSIKTPNIDKLAKEGMRFTNFYTSASVSSASRAGLLTGKLNNRNGAPGVFFPGQKGMPSKEITLGERLQKEGYHTACFGKWHLGDAPGHMPNDQGFDKYFGIPYSNDMTISPFIKLSTDAKFNFGWTLKQALKDQKMVADNAGNHEFLRTQNLRGVCPLVKDSLIVDYPCDQRTLTRRYFEHAIKFISRYSSCSYSKDKSKEPFFCYITPNMPHIPLAASEKFLGSSQRGLYGDAVQEVDYYIGQLMEYLHDNNLDENTLVIFASDNGPWISVGERGGCALPFRDGKFNSYEGGVRLPFIVRWTGKIPANSENNNIFSANDVVPTVMNIVGYDKKMDVDGLDQTATLFDPNVKIRDHYLYVNGGRMIGLRQGNWIYLPFSGSHYLDGNPELFNIAKDIAQEHNLYKELPEKVKEMKEIYDKYKKQHPDDNTFLKPISKRAKKLSPTARKKRLKERAKEKVYFERTFRSFVKLK